MIDSLRADHMGCFGYERDTSPFMDRLAAESVFFERAYSQSSFTVESVISFFLGLYPSAHPWGAGQYANTNPDLSDMAQLFSKGGYHTGYFSNNVTLNITGVHRSFDEYGFMAHDFHSSGHGPRLTRRALRFLEEHREGRTFTYLHYIGPHWPYAPPDAYYLRFASDVYPAPLNLADDIRPNVPALVADGFGPGDERFEDLVVRYDAEIAFEDDAIRALFEGLRHLGVLEDTLIVLTADHGEEFLDHGFVEHAWSLYPESIHVPLFFWMPNLLPPTRVSEPVALVDVLPSVLDLAGLPRPAHALDGVSLFAHTDQRWMPHARQEIILSELLLPTRNLVRAIIEDNLLYIAAPKWLTPEACAEVSRDFTTPRIGLLTGEQPMPDPWGPLQYEALFDLQSDPTAHNNLLDERPEDTARMRAALDAYRKRCPPQLSDRQKIGRLPELVTPELRGFLEERGYPVVEELSGATVDTSSDEMEEMIRGLGYF